MDYYSIYKIGEVISKDVFFNQRLQAASWVHWDEFVNRVLSRDYDSIYPLHIELCSTYKCNFNCPWCSCRKSRFRKDNTKNELECNEIKRILENLKKHNIGIQWTGGEPLFNPATLFGINYGEKLGLKQCLFTNGSLLDENAGDIILQSNLKFVRISLNCVTPSYHSLFHGNISRELSEKVLLNIINLCKKKYNIKRRVKIGISIVIDSKNLDDLLNTIHFIKSVAVRYPLTLNYIIIRAVNDDFEGIETVKQLDFLSKYNSLIKKINVDEFNKFGIEIIFPNEVIVNYDVSQGKQLGCSIFSEISPDGSMSLCSDKYGNKAYIIGNILSNSIEEIWDSSQKKQIQKQQYDCFSSGNCPHYSRGWYFNMIFSQIEKLRDDGKMGIVNHWIQSLKESAPHYDHSFYL